MRQLHHLPGRHLPVASLKTTPAAAGAPAGHTAGVPVRRPARPGDDALLFDLFRAANGGMLAGLDPTLAVTVLRQQYAGQVLSYRTAHPAAQFDVLEVDGRPVGRIVTDASGEAIRLVDVALLPEWRGRGLGTCLLRVLQGDAGDAGVPLRLSVLSSNAGARRLYKRLGFVPDGATGTHLAMRWDP